MLAAAVAAAWRRAMLALEVLVRAAAGDGAAARSVAEEVRQVGWRDWAREAIRSRLDPLLAVAVLPSPARVEVARALVVFYGNWGGCFPREYRRVRQEWRVLRDRWQAGGRARAYGELLAAVGAPLPALAGLAAAACTRAGSAFVTAAAAEDWEPARRPPESAKKPAPTAAVGGTEGAAGGAGGTAGRLMLDEPLAPEEAARDADAAPAGDAGGAPTREETGVEGLQNVVAGAGDGVLPDGSRMVSAIGPEAAGDAPWMERMREAAGREPSVAAELRELWLDAESDGEGWFGEWLEPTVSRSRERAGR